MVVVGMKECRSDPKACACLLPNSDLSHYLHLAGAWFRGRKPNKPRLHLDFILSPPHCLQPVLGEGEMAKFRDLPQELLPEVFEHVYKSSHLAKLCLVNRLFNTYAVSRLYATILVYAWHKEVKSKVIMIRYRENFDFRTRMDIRS